MLWPSGQFLDLVNIKSIHASVACYREKVCRMANPANLDNAEANVPLGILSISAEASR